MTQITLMLAIRAILPLIVALVRLCLTIPVSSATAERSFSTLRRLKTYLRSQIGQARLIQHGKSQLFGFSMVPPTPVMACLNPPKILVVQIVNQFSLDHWRDAYVTPREPSPPDPSHPRCLKFCKRKLTTRFFMLNTITLHCVMSIKRNYLLLTLTLC